MVGMRPKGKEHITAKTTKGNNFATVSTMKTTTRNLKGAVQANWKTGKLRTPQSQNVPDTSKQYS